MSQSSTSNVKAIAAVDDVTDQKKADEDAVPDYGSSNLGIVDEIRGILNQNAT